MDTYNFPEHRSTDTFEGVSFTINVNGTPLDLTGASIKATFVQNFKQTFTLTSPTHITITDASNGTFEIDQQVIGWEPGTYNYNIQITLVSGVIKTYIKGVWVING